MAVKRISGRSVQKHDTTANWNKAINFVPLEGEIIIYTDVNKMKIGDGVTTVGELPWASGEGGVPIDPETTKDGDVWVDTDAQGSTAVLDELYGVSFGHTQSLSASQKAIARSNIGSESEANKITSLSSSSTDTQYPSAKCVYDIIGNVEALLAAI